MTSLLAMFVPAGLLAVTPAMEAGDEVPANFLPESVAESVVEQQPAESELWTGMVEAFRPQDQEQVRIERRVIMRISPSSSLIPQLSMPPLERQSDPAEYEERSMSKCVPVKNISSVRVVNNNRLLLFMRDSRMVTAKLEKSCNVRDFYSGFYVENPQDGKICAGRDTIHSRAGANCELSRFYKLVAAGE